MDDLDEMTRIAATYGTGTRDWTDLEELYGFRFPSPAAQEERARIQSLHNARALWEAKLKAQRDSYWVALTELASIVAMNAPGLFEVVPEKSKPLVGKALQEKAAALADVLEESD